ncbi:MAG TPA: hypothetical protein VGQ20_03210 [Acidimicrobiales bacterium]|jgi:hypothetical protein|nr:hypothetical protein [Acidimicrobiales bacterium]
MRKTIASAAMAASLLGGGAIGAALFVPSIASAQDATTTDGSTDSSSTATDQTPSWLTDVLQGLVDDGTLTQAQADAVGERIAAARPVGEGRHGGGHAKLDVVATAIGIDESALRDALDSGQTIAEVAAANNVDIQVVIDALVADLDTRLADDVADGRLTQDQADARKADAVDRLTALVNGELPIGGPGFGPGGARPA